MNYKRLRSSRVMVPEIGLGTWRYTGAPEPLRRGVELGANLIDPAEIYRTEAAVGEAIAGIRDKVIVATKVLGSNLRYDEVLKAADRSLRLLGVDKIDLYQIHWPNPRVPVEETMRAIDWLVSHGLVEHVGVSNFSVDEMQAAQAATPNVPIVSNQILYNLRRRSAERDVIPYCRRNDITVIAYSPLHEGALADAIRTIGDTTYDVYLNERAYWRNVPAAVWNYQLGGYQVLKKWLSYREGKVLTRPLLPEEVQHFTDTARRVGAIVRLVNRT